MPGFWARPGMGEPRDRPRPQSTTPFSRKEFITQNLALIFQVLPAPSSSLHPMNGETKCARFLGSPGPAAGPENLAHLLLPSLHHRNAKTKCAGMWGSPRSAPTPVKHVLFTKRIYHSKSGPGFSIFARSLLLPTPNERRNQMCQVFGLARARGARKPGTFAPSLLAPQQRQGHMWRNRPQSKTPFSRKEFITQNLALIFQFLPAPSSSLHPTERPNVPGFWARPGPRSPKTWHICSFLPCTTATARTARLHVSEWGEPRDRPRPQSKTPFSRKDFIIQNQALIFHVLPAPSSSLHPLNGETKCARFLGSPLFAEPENLAHLLLPSLHHSNGKNGKATCVGMGGTPRSAPTPIKNALFTKRLYHSKSGPDFSSFARSFLLPTPNERRDQMCQVFGLALVRGARKPGTFAPSLLRLRLRR